MVYLMTNTLRVTLIITLTNLVTLQAEQQLGPGWTLMRSGTPQCPEIQDWLASSLPSGGRVGIDPFLHTVRPFFASPPLREQRTFGECMSGGYMPCHSRADGGQCTGNFESSH